MNKALASLIEDCTYTKIRDRFHQVPDPPSRGALPQAVGLIECRRVRFSAIANTCLKARRLPSSWRFPAICWC